MTHTTIVLLEDDWIEQFRPIKNHLNKNAGCVGFDPENQDDGCMFETYGDELDYIKKILKGKVSGMSESNIWTWLDGDHFSPSSRGGLKLKELGCTFVKSSGDWHQDGMQLSSDLIGNGFHYVNRIGYYVTRVPAPDNTDFIIVADEAMVEAYTGEMV